MTIVCGYKDRGGKVWLGADSRTVGGRHIFPESVEKIIRHGRWTVGHSGNETGLALLRRKGQAIAETDDPYEVVEIMQGLYKEADYKRRPDDNGAPDYSQACILATASEVWGVSPDGSVWKPTWGFAAIGSGQDIAYGAAYVAHHFRVVDDGEHVVRMAIEAACQFDVGCGGEIRVGSVE